MKEARDYISASAGGGRFDCLFTSGGTEADNTAIFSFARRGNAVTTLGEHSAVFEPFKHLPQGVETRFAALRSDGSANVDDLLSKIDEKTSFVSVVHVNNETGAINDINAIAEEVKRINPKTVFHSDGVQAFCKIPFKLSGAVDLYSVSAHKIGGLKGTGALIKSKNLHLHPLIYGGGQENGLRSGTENVYGIAAFYAAAKIKNGAISENFRRAEELKKIVLGGVDREIFDVISPEGGSPYILCVTAAGLKGEVLQHKLEGKGIIVGTGSACSSRNPHSRVLRECGYSSSKLEGVLRISFAPENDAEDAELTVRALNEAAAELKKIMRN
ncbi:MAG: aminotransferase class V-fold PLP-dependent enzyme [Clostridia bacterium]|nr:aminotransferase class V-fold PLP-dependent enzyme [Clostridia bacterium]